jgi:hypothetical protein
LENKTIIIESTPKSQKKENATKTPRHQNTQKKENQMDLFGEILCFRALVAIKGLFGVDSSFTFKT